ncbi:hypothetical protein A0H76_256 [Hepatospora eriocheir]|uniref:Uncharacterized protein n=1 Tax=Hepatospora eriocheir TaxID=1081669 RepID=A0A1X0QJ10_9MICR|nr:hypothetical protein A0H76_256 [Hepatospora eriocheir]
MIKIILKLIFASDCNSSEVNAALSTKNNSEVIDISKYMIKNKKRSSFHIERESESFNSNSNSFIISSSSNLNSQNQNNGLITNLDDLPVYQNVPQNQNNGLMPNLNDLPVYQNVPQISLNDSNESSNDNDNTYEEIDFLDETAFKNEVEQPKISFIKIENEILCEDFEYENEINIEFKNKNNNSFFKHNPIKCLSITLVFISIPLIISIGLLVIFILKKYKFI